MKHSFIVGDLGLRNSRPGHEKSPKLIGQDRLRVGSEHGTQSIVLQRSPILHIDLKSATKSGSIRITGWARDVEFASHELARTYISSVDLSRKVSGAPIDA